MQLDPHRVAGLDRDAVDPREGTRLGAVECRTEPVVVAGEAVERGGEAGAERPEPAAVGRQLVEHPAVPHRVVVVVGGQPVPRLRADLPPGQRRQEARVQRGEGVVGGLDLGSGAGRLQLLGQPPLPLGPARVGDRPPGDAAELVEAQRAAEAVAATANSGRVLDGLAKKLKASLGQFRV